MRTVHYFSGLKPMMILKVPWPTPRWRDILKALTPVMRDHDLYQKDFQPSGLLPDPDIEEEWDSENTRFAGRLDAAFSGDPSAVPAFWLYEWYRGRFRLVRGPMAQKR